LSHIVWHVASTNGKNDWDWKQTR